MSVIQRTIPAIAMWQPWASLWLSPRKRHETRHWQTDYVGWLAVHATKKIERNLDFDDPLSLICDDEFGRRWRNTLPTGAIIGAVHVVGCKSTKVGGANKEDEECGDWSEGRFAIERDKYCVFDLPIPWSARQGKLLSLPHDIVEAVCFQLENGSIRQAGLLEAAP